MWEREYLSVNGVVLKVSTCARGNESSAVVSGR